MVETTSAVTALAGPGFQGLVVKDRVHLGGLGAAQRLRALACVWAGLPDAPMSEREVNAALQVALAGAACWLDTDHVELRRWLVDTGWLQRDGFGRVYQRALRAGLSPAWQHVADALDEALGGQTVAAWVAAQRSAHEVRRAARRQAWANGGAAAASTR
jgi:hypothetical protein